MNGLQRSSRAVMALGLALGISTAAQAAITIDTTINGVTLDFGPNPAHLPNHVVGNGVTSGNTLTLISDDGHLIDYTAPTTLVQSGGAGFATVSGPGNGNNAQGFASLSINPQASMDGFTKINFGLKALGTGNSTYYGDIVLNLLGGGNVTFENVAFSTGGVQHFSVFSADNRIFSSIQFGALATLENGGVGKNFESIRQVSINLANAPGVPEPATWGMMILGFGLIGGTLRRRGRSALSAAV